MGKLNGRVAVVTGASKGIGASIAEHLSAEGASVIVNYATTKSGADAVVARITSKGGKAIAVQGSVAVPQDIDRIFAETKKAFSKVDILVNNAGIYEFAPLDQITREHIQKHFDLNVTGLLLTTKEAVKLMRPSGVSRSCCSLNSPLSRPEARRPSVSTMPGSSEFTRILRGPSSLASEIVIASTAALLAL